MRHALVPFDRSGCRIGVDATPTSKTGRVEIDGRFPHCAGNISHTVSTTASPATTPLTRTATVKRPTPVLPVPAVLYHYKQQRGEAQGRFSGEQNRPKKSRDHS
jgi:hypothetical protein